MSSYCLNCRKIQKTFIQQFQKLEMVEQYYYQNVLYVVVKNHDLLKNKKKRITKYFGS